MLFVVMYLLISIVLYILGYVIHNKGNHINIVKNKTLFYVLSFTWGLPLNLIGAILTLMLMICGVKPKKYGWFIHLELNVNFGLNLGVFIIAPPNCAEGVRIHECGHGVQNVILGIFTPAVILLPSSIRFNVRNLLVKLGRPPKNSYYDIWFENQANVLGKNLISVWKCCS